MVSPSTTSPIVGGFNDARERHLRQQQRYHHDSLPQIKLPPRSTISGPPSPQNGPSSPSSSSPSVENSPQSMAYRLTSSALGRIPLYSRLRASFPGDQPKIQQPIDSNENDIPLLAEPRLHRGGIKCGARTPPPSYYDDPIRTTTTTTTGASYMNEQPQRTTTAAAARAHYSTMTQHGSLSEVHSPRSHSPRSPSFRPDVKAFEDSAAASAAAAAAAAASARRPVPKRRKSGPEKDGNSAAPAELPGLSTFLPDNAYTKSFGFLVRTLSGRETPVTDLISNCRDLLQRSSTENEDDDDDDAEEIIDDDDDDDVNEHREQEHDCSCFECFQQRHLYMLWQQQQQGGCTQLQLQQQQQQSYSPPHLFPSSSTSYHVREVSTGFYQHHSSALPPLTARVPPPPPSKPLLHRLTAYTIYTFFSLSYLLYPHLKQALTAAYLYERENHLRERAAASVVASFNKLWTFIVWAAGLVAVLGNMKIIAPATISMSRVETVVDDGNNKVQEKQAREFLAKALEEIVGGVLEGAQMGLGVWGSSSTRGKGKARARAAMEGW